MARAIQLSALAIRLRTKLTISLLGRFAPASPPLGRPLVLTPERGKARRALATREEEGWRLRAGQSPFAQPSTSSITLRPPASVLLPFSSFVRRAPRERPMESKKRLPVSLPKNHDTAGCSANPGGSPVQSWRPLLTHDTRRYARSSGVKAGLSAVSAESLKRRRETVPSRKPSSFGFGVNAKFPSRSFFRSSPGNTVPIQESTLAVARLLLGVLTSPR